MTLYFPWDFAGGVVEKSSFWKNIKNKIYIFFCCCALHIPMGLLTNFVILFFFYFYLPAGLHDFPMGILDVYGTALKIKQKIIPPPLYTQPSHNKKTSRYPRSNKKKKSKRPKVMDTLEDH